MRAYALVKYAGEAIFVRCTYVLYLYLCDEHNLFDRNSSHIRYIKHDINDNIRI